MGNSQSKPISPRTKATAPEIIPNTTLSKQLATKQILPSAVDNSQNFLRPTQKASMRLNEMLFGPEIITSIVVNSNSQSDDKTEDKKQDEQADDSEELEDWVYVMTSLSKQRDPLPEHNSTKLGSPIQFFENNSLFVGRRTERKGAARRNFTQTRQTPKFKSQLQLEGEENGFEFMSPFTLVDDRGHASKIKSIVDPRTRF